MTRPGQYVRKTKEAPRIWVNVARPDWAALINELVRFGYPKQQIAMATNSSKEMVYAMHRGSTPPWDIGQAVLALVEVARAG